MKLNIFYLFFFSLSIELNDKTVAALNMTTTRRREEENDTMEVVVDGDDTSTYGYTQYTETDIHAAMNRTESRSPTPARNQDANSEGSSRLAYFSYQFYLIFRNCL